MFQLKIQTVNSQIEAEIKQEEVLKPILTQ
jgi:hypothetical protein